MTDIVLPRPDVVILCGGQGQRMGGRDKGLIALSGKPLYEHVLAQLPVEWVGRVYLSANRNQRVYSASGLPVLPDVRPGYLGPLAGIEAALLACEADWLFVVPCDMPQLPPDLFEQLWSVRETAQVIRAKAGERVQPLCCLIKRTALAGLQKALDSGQRAVIPWQDAVGAIDVAFSGELINANSPVSLARVAGQQGGLQRERQTLN